MRVFKRALVLFIVGYSFTGWSASEDRPNIIVILTDDMGYSDIGSYGSEIETPNIDSLADNGVKFTQFYNTARCCPTRASLLTGLYPHQAGVGHMLRNDGSNPGYDEGLTSDTVTIAQVLKQAGYGTYMTGKWHVSRYVDANDDKSVWPLQKGFDKFYGILAGYGSLFDPNTLTRQNEIISAFNDPEYKPESYYFTDAITDNSIKYIQEHTKENGDKPFFLYAAYTAAHWPLHALPEDMKKYEGKYSAGYDEIRKKRFEKMKKQGVITEDMKLTPTVGDWDKVENKPWEERNQEAFAAMIDRMDQGIGRIIEELKKNGQYDNTLILYLHDNGGCAENNFNNRPPAAPKKLRKMAPEEIQTKRVPPMQTRDGKAVKAGVGVMAGPEDTYLQVGLNWANVSNTPFREFKHWVHEGGIATPFIAHWPKGISEKAKNVIINTPSHLIDIMATCVDVAKADYPKEFDGHKIQPMEGISLREAIVEGKEPDSERMLFWEHESNRAVRDGKWKLVAKENAPWELYDIEKDRAELNNLAEKFPDEVTRLEEAWNVWAKRAKVLPLGAWKNQPPPKKRPVNNQTKWRLKGDAELSREESPNIKNAGIDITVELEEVKGDGVLVSQGGTREGYSLYVKDDKLTFVVVRNRKTDIIQADSGLGTEVKSVRVKFGKDKNVELFADGKSLKKGKFKGLFNDLPNDGVVVGGDYDTTVGDYDAEFEYKGKIKSVSIDLLK